ncbi:uncharacterized protein EURHEDRAFT_403709 [Aspergillus ruber CBS 135680]|uniref:Uncharacterized protein n=1 Tax=Aspergillus ruber (strain CBS 135680) TaxID=1388766 RepID=A0A017SAN7_ASPRC|nr:uncharacterized protein EURHEDRAFT_403709 [Aspergillus ruber CBS 135680]EYE93997.1 hypothetical protein EURHEDRAFT_403709 [Aspergillus ruber CBS 135680]
MDCWFPQNWEDPVISFEAKRRHAAVMHVGSWKDEGYCENILEQKVAKLLGQAMENNRQVLATMLIDQEAFAINVCGTKLKIPVTYFTGDYLVAVNIKTIINHASVYTPEAPTINDSFWT